MKPPRSLFNLQNSFMAAILLEDLAKTEALILDKAPLNSKERFEIYQDGYQFRILESLKEDFQRVRKLVGEEAFEEHAKECLQRHPSTYTNLAEYSQNFVSFTESKSAELFELASLDWLEILCDQAPAINAKTQLSLEEVTAGVAFELVKNPSVQIFESKTKSFVIYKRDELVYCDEIEGAGAAVILQLKQPISLDEITELMLTRPMDLEKAQELMSTWIKNEILICQRIKT
jgi:hypothetical protein